jgi:prevent-host-death family protein
LESEKSLWNPKSITIVSLVKTELVTTLKRKATNIIASVEKTRAPVLITQHGRPAAYLVDVETFEGLNEKLAVLETISRGERAVEAGRVLSHEAAKKRMARWLK